MHFSYLSQDLIALPLAPVACLLEWSLHSLPLEREHPMFVRVFSKPSKKAARARIEAAATTRSCSAFVRCVRSTFRFLRAPERFQLRACRKLVDDDCLAAWLLDQIFDYSCMPPGE